MKRLLLPIAVGLLVAPVLAGPDVLPIDGVRYVNYDAATGEITPVTAETRSVMHPIWSAGFEYVGFFWGREYDLGEGSGDWGDVAGPAVVGGFEFSSFTNSMLYDGDLWAVVLLYTEDNGFCSAGKTYTAGIRIDNIPGSSDFPTVYRGHLWRVGLVDPAFVLDGSDLDGDGLGDFGYFMFLSGRTPGGLHGPGIWGTAFMEPNNLPPEAPGVTNYVDVYEDPNWNLGAQNIEPNNLAYIGTGYFSPPAYGQIHMVLFAPSCPNRGESGRFCTADIDGSVDCIVGLTDLSQLLAHYGMTTGATLSIGDVDPYDEWMLGDGDVDLGDLAELLSQYGDNCNWPQP